MTNINFKIKSFSEIKPMFDYGMLFQTMETNIEDNKYLHRIGLKTPEDIKRFLGQAKICQTELFRMIDALSKALYHCDRKEIKPDEMDTLLALYISLCEMGIEICEKTKDMTTENTFPFDE